MNIAINHHDVLEYNRFVKLFIGNAIHNGLAYTYSTDFISNETSITLRKNHHEQEYKITWEEVDCDMQSLVNIIIDNFISTRQPNTAANKTEKETKMKTTKPNGPSIIDVIYNPPATVVFWDDGSKTVVKCGEHDIYDPEKGLAMAVAKKAFGNEGNYYETFKEWLPSKFDWSDLDEYNKVDGQNTYDVFKSALSDLKKKCEDFVERYYSPKPNETTHAKDAHTCGTCGWQDNEDHCYLKECFGCENQEHWTPYKYDC